MSLLWSLIIDIAVLSGHDIIYVTIIVLGEAKFTAIHVALRHRIMMEIGYKFGVA